MEEMETVFEQGQALEQRRIIFLKGAFLALHRRLDVTAEPRCEKGSAEAQTTRYLDGLFRMIPQDLLILLRAFCS